MDLSFQKQTKIIANLDPNEAFFYVKIIFIYRDRLTGVKLFPNLSQKMNRY